MEWYFRNDPNWLLVFSFGRGLSANVNEYLQLMYYYDILNSNKTYHIYNYYKWISCASEDK